jgi:hypothetical protein
VEFIHGRAEDVVLPGDFDCITSCYLAKYADLGLLVNRAHDMLREGELIQAGQSPRVRPPIGFSATLAKFRLRQKDSAARTQACSSSESHRHNHPRFNGPTETMPAC